MRKAKTPSPKPSLSQHPRLLGSLCAALLCAAVLMIWPNTLTLTTRLILSWDAGVLCFLALITKMMYGCDVNCLQTQAENQDEGRNLILGLTIVAAAAALMAIGVELSLAKHVHGLERFGRVLLAFATMALSWLFVHVIFALHYAHEFYAPDLTEDDKGVALRYGLEFPDGQLPDYWDFIHFALVIGVASQTGDICFTSRAQRRIGTLHCVVSFVFNAMVLALTINLLASLF